MIKLKELVGLPSLQYHIDNGLTLYENVYRYSSEEFINLFTEARNALSNGDITLNKEDKYLIENTDIGEYGDYNGMKVPLDLPMTSEGKDPLFEIGCLIDEMLEDEDLLDEGSSNDDMINYEMIQELVESIGCTINMESLRRAVAANEEMDYNGFDMLKASVDYVSEADYKGKKVQLNKPKRGGSKKFYVYVKNPKTGNVKKVSFGDTGLSVKLKQRGARASFAARHKCSTKKDKTKAGYWSCNIGRYWKSLGGSSNFSGYW
jgi:hypothetical protein